MSVQFPRAESIPAETTIEDGMGRIAAARGPLVFTCTDGACAGIVNGDTLLRALTRQGG